MNQSQSTKVEFTSVQLNVTYTHFSRALAQKLGITELHKPVTYSSLPTVKALLTEIKWLFVGKMQQAILEELNWLEELYENNPEYPDSAIKIVVTRLD